MSLSESRRRRSMLFVLLTSMTLVAAQSEASPGREIEGQFGSALLDGGRALQPARATVSGRSIDGFRAEASDIGTGDLQMFYPQSYDEPFIAQLGSQRVVLRALAARGAAAEIDAGRVSFRDVYDAVDSVQVASHGRSEEFLLLRSEAAPKTYEYEIVETEGVSRVVLQDGAVHFLRTGEPEKSIDAAGGFGPAPVLRIERPWLIDAEGRRSDEAVRWEIDGGGRRLRLIVDATNLTYPLLVDPTFSATGSMPAGVVRSTPGEAL